MHHIKKYSIAIRIKLQLIIYRIVKKTAYKKIISSFFNFNITDMEVGQDHLEN